MQLKKTYRMCTRLRAQRGGSRMAYLLDALRCSVRHGASPENYFVLRFFELTEQQRATYLTSGRSAALDRVLNRNASAAEKEALGSKARFLAAFAPFVRRAHVYAPEADFAAFNAFLDHNATFFLKPVSGTMGRGHRAAQHRGHPGPRRVLCRLPRAATAARSADPAAPCTRGAQPRLRQQRAHQCRARPRGRVRLIGACLKCGRAERRDR